MKKIIALMLILVGICAFTACSNKNTTSDKNAPSTTASDEQEFVKPKNYASVLIVTINPQFKLYLDENDTVLAVEPVNTDAKEIIDSITFENESVETVVDKVVTVANKEGFIKENATINLELVEAVDSNVDTSALLNKVTASVNQAVSDLELKVNVKAEDTSNIETESDTEEHVTEEETKENVTEEATTEEVTTEEPTTEEAVTEEVTTGEFVTEEVTVEPTTEAPTVNEAPVVSITDERHIYECAYQYYYDGNYYEGNGVKSDFWLEYEYDKKGNLIKTFEYSGEALSGNSYESTWEYIYDDNGNLIHEIEYFKDGNKRLEKFYDGKGNRTKIILYNKDGTTSMQEDYYEYDEYGRAIKSRQRQIEKGVESEWCTWLVEYDKYNNETKRSHYDENGNFLDASGFEYVYAKGWDEFWLNKSYTYNAAGEIVAEHEANYTFDENGYIIEKTGGWGTSKIIYENGVPVKTVWIGTNSYTVAELVCVTVNKWKLQ